MRQITKNQNRFAWVVGIFISLFVVTMTIYGITDAKGVTLLELINQSRSKPLVVDLKLTVIAFKRCKTMKEFSHEGFYYLSHDLYKMGYSYLGETLAGKFDSPKLVFDALQASPTHRSNNENPKFQRVGIANCVNKLGDITVIIFTGK